jgi:5-methylcytosine-specific restriction protein A
MYWGCEVSSMGSEMLKHLCKAVGCGRIVESKSSYCPLHEYKQREDDERKMKWLSGQSFKYREPWHEWYNTTRWRKLRDTIIKSNPECVVCGNPATVIDHIVPHRGQEELFFDESNLQALCSRCHKDKTLAEMASRRKAALNK